MDNFLQQKKQWQQNFRVDIQKFMAQSKELNEHIQLSPQLIISALSSTRGQNSIIKNGKINIESLEDAVNTINGSRIMPRVQFLKLFGNRKQLRPSQLCHLLEQNGLGEFNMKEQVKRFTFQNGNLSIKKLDKMMVDQGFKVLNAKDKSILLECFDMNKDLKVCQKDFEELLRKLDKIRNNQNQSGSSSQI